MRILLLNQFFWPDAAATSQLLTDVARALAAQGHEVHAIAAGGGYATDKTSDKPDVIIHRAPALPFSRGKVGRIASYLSFLSTAVVKGLAIPKPDVVLSLTTPPLISVIGHLLKLLRGSNHFIWEMDVYPDIAVSLNVLKPDTVLTRMAGAIADHTRANADGVIALGECMRENLIRHGIPDEKIFVAENWADGSNIEPAPYKHTSGETPLTVLYSGNLGLAHDIDTVFGAMEHLSEDPGFHFIFAGGGANRAALESRAKSCGLTNVQFRPYSSRQGLAESLSQGDIGLVTQLPASLGSLVPSKIYGLLAVGRPILFVGPKDATPARIVRKFGCGWHIDCGDSIGLSSLLIRLRNDRDAVREAGHAARAAFLEHYNLPQGVGRICDIIGVSAPGTRNLRAVKPLLQAE